MKVLIVEDEPQMLKEIVDFLTERGFLCEQAADFNSAEYKLSIYSYDIVVLDLGLPDGDGLDLLKEIKAGNPQCGTLIISAKNSLSSTVKGLSDGADDYLTKPFHLEELNSRLTALYRRRRMSGFNILDAGALTIDLDGKTAHLAKHNLNLTPKEFQLLLYLVVNKDRVLSKQVIAEHLWGDHYDISENYFFVYVHINNLKKKLRAHTENQFIFSVYGTGYKFSTSEIAS
jgi:DNA-binding response OmpR family regulator